MAKSDIITRSAYLTVRGKTSDRFLFSGKIDKEKMPQAFFFYLIEVLCPWFPSTKVPKTITKTIDNYEINDPNKPLEELFEDIIVKINESLGSLAQSGEKDWIGNLNAVIGLATHEEILLAQTGSVSGHIYRNGKISTITERPSLHEPPSSKQAFSNVISGSVSEGDRIILGTNELYNHLSLDRLRKMSANGTAKTIINELYLYFRRLKVTNLNAISIEIINLKEASNQTLDDLPEQFYLDDPIDTPLKKFRRNITPYQDKIVKQTASSYRWTKENTGRLISSFQQSWHDKYGPKSHELISKGKKRAEKISDNISPAIKPIAHKAASKISDSSALNTIKQHTTSGYRSLISQIVGKTSPAVQAILNRIGSFVRSLPKPQNRKYIYATLIAILVLGVYLKIHNKSTAQQQMIQENTLAKSYDEARVLFNAAKEDVALGKTGGVEKMYQAMETAQKSLEYAPTKDSSAQLVKEIQLSLDNLTATERVYASSPATALGNNIKKFTLFSSEILGIGDNGKIYSTHTQDWDSRLVASIGKEYGTAVDLTNSHNTNKVFIYTDKNKVLLYDPLTSTFSEVATEDEQGIWKNANAIGSYSTNIYLLDASENQIWKYSDHKPTYSKASAYTTSRKPSLSNAIDLAVDGDIYVLHSDTAVTKFTRGTHETTFSLKPLPVPNIQIEQPTSIFTNSDTPYLYIFDNKQNRIVKFSKTGEFINQYTLDGAQIHDFVVNSKLQKLWILSDGNIFEVNI